MNRLRRPVNRGKEADPVGETNGSVGGRLDPDAGQEELALGGGTRPGAAAGAASAVPAAASTGAAALPGMEDGPSLLVLVHWRVSPGSSAVAAALAAARASGVGTSMMPAGADAAADGGWPEWWSNIAVAALGQDWLRGDPSMFAGISTAGRNQTFDEARLYSASVGNQTLEARAYSTQHQPEICALMKLMSSQLRPGTPTATASVDERVLARGSSTR
ncbi:unnamed protein product [Urochloa humidicola]